MSVIKGSLRQAGEETEKLVLLLNFPGIEMDMSDRVDCHADGTTDINVKMYIVL